MEKPQGRGDVGKMVDGGDGEGELLNAALCLITSVDVISGRLLISVLSP